MCKKRRGPLIGVMPKTKRKKVADSPLIGVMPKTKRKKVADDRIWFGWRVFAEYSEEIDASNCGASDVQVVALGLKIMAGVVANLKMLKLVSVCSFDALIFSFDRVAVGAG